MDLIFICVFMVEVEEPVGPPRESYFTSGILSSLTDKIAIIPTSCDCEEDNRYESTRPKPQYILHECLKE